MPFKTSRFGNLFGCIWRWWYNLFFLFFEWCQSIETSWWIGMWVWIVERMFLRFSMDLLAEGSFVRMWVPSGMEMRAEGRSKTRANRVHHGRCSQSIGVGCWHCFGMSSSGWGDPRSGCVFATGCRYQVQKIHWFERLQSYRGYFHQEESNLPIFGLWNRRSTIELWWMFYF